jgi:hypothetical protein
VGSRIADEGKRRYGAKRGDWAATGQLHKKHGNGQLSAARATTILKRDKSRLAA